MTRELHVVTTGTDFGKWIRKQCRDSGAGLSVTDMDGVLYALEDFRDRKKRRFMLVEEKTRMGRLDYGQSVTLQFFDWALRRGFAGTPHDYRGFFVVQFDGASIYQSTCAYINGVAVASAELARHLNFDEKIAPPLDSSEPETWERFMRRGSLASIEQKRAPPPLAIESSPTGSGSEQLRIDWTAASGRPSGA